MYYGHSSGKKVKNICTTVAINKESELFTIPVICGTRIDRTVRKWRDSSSTDRNIPLSPVPFTVDRTFIAGFEFPLQSTLNRLSSVVEQYNCHWYR